MMNCDTIDSLLDDHLVSRLSASERQRAADHVGGCARCSAAWAADDALRGETMAHPAPDLFAALLSRISAAPARLPTRRRRLWASLAAAAAALVIAAVAARWAVVELELRPELSVNAWTMKYVFRRNAAAPPEVSPASPAAAALPFVAGRHYEVLPGAAPRNAVAAGDAVEVIEFFMYWCDPCYAFEPDLVRWEAAAADRASLTRVPALFNARAELLARAYYTAEALGKLDAMHAELYDEIHARGNPLATRAALAELFERSGVERAAFDAAFDSSYVEARMRRAAALNREYAIQATPSLVVAGRYATNPTLAGSWDAMLAIVDQLVAESRACRDRCDRARGR
jgi:thiol:disulfide interchange protein DsbA